VARKAAGAVAELDGIKPDGCWRRFHHVTDTVPVLSVVTSPLFVVDNQFGGLFRRCSKALNIDDHYPLVCP
jgi:hypothetical protein